MAVTKKQRETLKLIKPHLFNYRGRKAINMENGGLSFSQTLIFKNITPSGNVKLGEIIQSGPSGIKTINKIAKVRIISGKKVLVLGSGRGTDNYYLNL